MVLVGALGGIAAAGCGKSVSPGEGSGGQGASSGGHSDSSAGERAHAAGARASGGAPTGAAAGDGGRSGSHPTSAGIGGDAAEAGGQGAALPTGGTSDGGGAPAGNGGEPQGNGGGPAGNGGRPAGSCAEPEPWSSNLEACAGDYVHRPVASACALPRRDETIPDLPPDAGVDDPDDPAQCPVDPDPCSLDSECTLDADCGSGAYCLHSVTYRDFDYVLHHQCVAACEVDADCASDELCACETHVKNSTHETISMGVCRPAQCRTDQDCGDGFFCIAPFALEFDDDEWVTSNELDGFSCETPDCHANERCVIHEPTDCTDAPSVSGDFTLRTQADLEVLRGAGSVEGDVVLAGNYPPSPTSFYDLAPLGCLKSVSGVLRIGWSEIEDLRGLHSLTTAGSLDVTSNALLGTLAGLDSLESVGDLSISYNHALASLVGLTSLTMASGNVAISNNRGLETLTGLEGLRAATAVTLDSDGALTSVRALAGLEQGDVTIRNAPALPECDAEWLANALDDRVTYDDSLAPGTCAP